jgi:hypothetical protein
VLLFVSSFSLLLGILGLFAGLTGGGLETPTNATYLFAPLAVCPIAAHLMVRDREHGGALVAAATPLTWPECLVAKMLTVLVLTPMAVVVSLPILYAATLTTAPGAFVDLLGHPLFAVSIGTTAASVGLLVGALTPSLPRLGLSLAFFTVIAWIFLGTGLGETPNPPVALAFLRRLSPISHAVQAVVQGPILQGPTRLWFLPMTVAIPAFATFALTTVKLQHPTGWRANALGGSRFLSLPLAIVLLTAICVLPWTAPSTSAPAMEDRFQGRHGDLWIEGRLDVIDAPNPPWTQGVPRYLQLTLFGPPNATVEISDIGLESDVVRYEVNQTIPDRVHLDEIQPDHDRRLNSTGGPIGTTTLELRLKAYPTGLFNHFSADLLLVLDGRESRYVFTEVVAATWQVSPAPVAVAMLATVGPLTAMVRRLRGRWNRW